MLKKIIAGALSLSVTWSITLSSVLPVASDALSAENYSSISISDSELLKGADGYSEPVYSKAPIYEYGDPDKAVETVAIGDNITGTIYESGCLVISGYGEMHEYNSTPFKNAALVKQILFNNMPGEGIDGITNITANVFSGFTSLSSSYIKEKNQPLEGVVLLPDTINSIGRNVFGNCQEIKKLVVPDTVTSIGPNVFNGCTNLEVLQLPFAAGKKEMTDKDGVNDDHLSVSDLFIDHWRADNNTVDYSGYSISKIVITGGEKIPDYAFCNMQTLKEVDFSDSLISSVGAYAFYNCVGLDKIFFSDATQNIGTGAFQNCTSVTDLQLNNGLEAIGNSAFGNCTGIKELIVPDTVTSIGTNVLNGCANLEVLQLPFAAGKKEMTDKDGVNDDHLSVSDLFIDHWRADNNTVDYSGYSISKIVITGGEKIPDYAFCNMQTLKEVDFSKSKIASLGAYAFYQCTSLSTVKISKNMVSVGNGAYQKTLISELPDNGNITTIGSDAFMDCKNLKNISIPSSYTSFGNGAFRNCTGIKKLVVPDTVTSIGPNVFNGCTNLEVLQLPFAAGKKEMTDKDGVNDDHLSVSDLFIDHWRADNNTVDYSGYSISKIIITGGEKIPDYAFCNMQTLKEVDFSDSLISSVGAYAFYNCVGLDKIFFSDATKNIGTGAFQNCTSVTDLQLNNGLEAIGNSAFGNCTGIKELIVPDTVTSIEPNVLNGCTNLEVLQLPFAAGKKEMTDKDGVNDDHLSVSDLFIDHWRADNNTVDYSDYSISKIIITGGEKIPDYAFCNMQTLQEVDIYNSDIETIGAYAFFKCGSLDFIEIPESISNISGNAFSGFNGDVYIYNPDCIIDENAFPTDYSSTIYGFNKSTTDVFADTNDYNFESIDDWKILCPKNISLYKGNTYQIKTNLDNLTYSSDNKKAVSVSESGLIKAVENGKAVVKIESEDEELASINILVYTTAPATTTSITETITSDTTTTTTTKPVTTTTSKAATTTTKPVTTTTAKAATTTTKPVTTTTAKAATTTTKSVTTTTAKAATTTTKPVATTTAKATTTTYADIFTYKIRFSDEDGNDVIGVTYSFRNDVFVNSEPVAIHKDWIYYAAVTILSVPEGYVMPIVKQYNLGYDHQTYTLDIILADYNLGDVDGNGTVDASDASAVLAIYASVQTGDKSVLTDEIKKTADVDGNGIVDASDASAILGFYAYRQTGGDKSFDVYIKS